MASCLLQVGFVVPVGRDIDNELSSFGLVQCFADKAGRSWTEPTDPSSFEGVYVTSPL